LIILPQKRFFVKHFFQKLFDLFELVVRFFNVSILVLSLCFRRFQKSFFPAALGAQV